MPIVSMQDEPGGPGGLILHPPAYIDPGYIEPGPVKMPPINYNEPLPPAQGGNGTPIQEPATTDLKKYLPLLILGGALLVNMNGSKKVSGVPSWIIPAGIAAALILLKKKTALPPGPAGQTVDPPEQTIYDQLAAIIEADPVFTTKSFPANFYDAVKTEFQAPGTYNVNSSFPYSAKGWPGAFMAVADAWKSEMAYSEETHQKLWSVFSKWAALKPKQNLFSN